MIYSAESNQTKYPFILPDLPFNKEEFAPHFSVETFDYHHGKHHQAYVTNLNKLLESKTEFQDQSLEEIIIESAKDPELEALFNNAAQIWNHTFFWHSIKPQGGGEPSGKLLGNINQDFGNFEEFAKKFKEAAISQFGSGWVWLVVDNGKLKILKTSNAETPITKWVRPLIACDVWEHAYYIDYRNKRPDYVDVFLKNMINWEFANKNFLSS